MSHLLRPIFGRQTVSVPVPQSTVDEALPRKTVSFPSPLLIALTAFGDAEVVGSRIRRLGDAAEDLGPLLRALERIGQGTVGIVDANRTLSLVCALLAAAMKLYVNVCLAFDMPVVELGVPMLCVSSCHQLMVPPFNTASIFAFPVFFAIPSMVMAGVATR